MMAGQERLYKLLTRAQSGQKRLDDDVPADQSGSGCTTWPSFKNRSPEKQEAEFTESGVAELRMSRIWCTKSVTGVVALRSKWAAGKAVRAGLALIRSISGSRRD